MYYEDAANVAGITYESLNNWRNRGAAEAGRRAGNVKEGTAVWVREDPYFHFFQALKEAEGRALMGWMQKIEKAAEDGAWQAAAWKAERRYPERYGRTRVDQKTELSGPSGEPIEVHDMTSEERAARIIQILEIAQKRAAGSDADD